MDFIIPYHEGPFRSSNREVSFRPLSKISCLEEGVERPHSLLIIFRHQEGAVFLRRSVYRG